MYETPDENVMSVCFLKKRCDCFLSLHFLSSIECNKIHFV